MTALFPTLSPRRTALGALIAVLALVAVAFPAVSAAAEDDVTWTVRTASNNLGSERTNFTYTIDPGGSVSDALVVANHGADPIDLKIYAADGSTSADGQLALRVAGDQSSAVGAWVVPQTGTLSVAPGETATVPFTVAVPTTATPGDYAGGIVTTLAVPDAATGVSVDRRLGIRVNLRVGGELTPSLTVENVAVSWNGGLNPFAGGDATVTYTLHNTGNAALAAQPQAHVSGVFGLFGMDADDAAVVPALLPGESWTHTATVAGVAPLVALFGDVSVTPLVVDASGSTSPIADVTGSAVGVAIPWTLLVLILLLAAAVVLLLRRRGRRRDEEKARAQAQIDAAVAEALAQERAKDAVPVD